MKRILLNTTPPTIVTVPSPALSVLKGYLCKNGYEVDIKYWNIVLQNFRSDFFNFSTENTVDEIYNLLPYFSYWAVECKDIDLINKIACTVLKYKPELINIGLIEIINKLYEHHDRLDDFINRIVDDIDFNNYLYVGFTTLFNQWLCSNIIAKNIKKKYPDLKIIAGGFNSHKMAIAFLSNFEYYDYTTWGEGEISLKEFSEWCLSPDAKNDQLQNVPNLAYRDGELINYSKASGKYINLADIKLNFDDYFLQKFGSITVENSNGNIALPIEGSRGCRWNKCRFCILNEGYRYRSKKPDDILKEIADNTNKHNIASYVFLDNDVSGGDYAQFEILLDKLIEYKKIRNDFEIQMVEIVTKGITPSIIKKMSLSGIKLVQFGYESPSDNLLKKINKINSFASNLFYLKWSFQYTMEWECLFSIRNLLEEDDSDIKEAISNLYYLRFFYYNTDAKTTLLQISETSRYYKVIKNNGELANWEFSLIGSFLPNNYINNEDQFALLLDHQKSTYNLLWDNFKSVDEHLKTNKYHYQLIKNGNSINFVEKVNCDIINEIEFELEGDISWEILKAANSEILSFDLLRDKFSFF